MLKRQQIKVMQSNFGAGKIYYGKREQKMKTATHKSKCGTWLYKKSDREFPISEYEHRFIKPGLRIKPMQFWDIYCGKWRESCVDGKNTIEIGEHDVL